MRSNWVSRLYALGTVGIQTTRIEIIYTDAYFLYSHDLYHHYMYQGICELIGLYWAVCDRIGNSGRNRNRIAMIWPEPEPDCHPKKVAGFDRIGRI